ncbi:MAG: sulfatase-like hydrolase/transferase [Bryobacteraceae bacterium]
MGEITKVLKSAGVENNTLLIFTSDNGPWAYGNHAGKTPYRESKATGFDGGTRSPCIIRYPGRIPAGTISKRLFYSIDLLPTIASLTGAALPQHPIDGKDVWDLITAKPGAVNPHEYYPFTTGPAFEGVFSGDGRWKFHLPHEYRTLQEPGHNGAAGKYQSVSLEMSLFDMEADPLESRNVIAAYPDVAERLKAIAERHRKQFFN